MLHYLQNPGGLAVEQLLELGGCGPRELRRWTGLVCRSADPQERLMRLMQVPTPARTSVWRLWKASSTLLFNSTSLWHVSFHAVSVFTVSLPSCQKVSYTLPHLRLHSFVVG